jgi:dolichyl-phosphate-mannose-protein mannosyltransferase
MANPMNERVASWLQARHALLMLFALGLGIRLALARHSEGLEFDVGLFRQWSDRLVERGPAHFYEPGYFADYPPGYLYVLFVLGKISRLLRGEPPSVGVLKLPAIIADLGVAVFALLLAGRITSRGVAGRIPLGVAAAAAILLNPGLILVSAVWGQVDSVLALLVLAGIYALAAERPSMTREMCGVVVLAIAVATKPQAVLALPVLAIVVVRRHLGVGDFGWRAWSKIAARVGLYVVLAVAVIVAMFAPFGVGPTEIPGFYRSGGSVYPFTSLWAFNVWGAAGFYRRDVGPGALSVGGVAAYYVGLAAFAGATIALMVRAWRSFAWRVDANAVALFGVVAVTCAAFALLTRMHERYLYLAVAGLAPLVGHRPFRRALAIMSALFFLNVHFVYVLFSGSSLGDRAWTIHPVYRALFGLAKDAWQRKALSIATATVCLAVATLGWRWLDRTGARSRPRAYTSDAQT